MTVNRVTQSMMTDRSLSNLQLSLGRLAETQEHLSTGRVLNRPSDNPTDAAAAMRLRSAIAGQQQYVRNAEDGLGWLNTIDATLQGVSSQVHRARDLALQGANAATGPTAREALAVEIEQIREGLLSAANTTYLDRPVFGGTVAGSVAYTDPAGVATYVGDGNPVTRTVAPGVSVDVQLAGPAAFGADGDSVLDHLTALATALRAGDTAEIRAGIDRLSVDGDRVASALADVGARTLRIEQAADRATGAELDLTNALSEIENADLPETMVALQMQEVAYQAALAATSRVLQPSLLDFLR
jgi:flagellar hook-associated protein 3 FlgL